MTNRLSFTSLLLQLCICLQVANGFSPCFIDNTKAFCGVRRLNQVPPLPNYIMFLDLSLNYISEIDEKSFSGLEALQILKIQQQETQLVLKNNAFKGLSNLRELNLGFNHLLQLEPGAFNGLFNLQTLNLIQCSLNDSILSGDYLKPLVSLERLTLETNSITRIQPAHFFFNMTKFHELDLSHNWINNICEEDLFGFQGKHFTLLKLTDIRLTDMGHFWPKWDQCGNPFKNMSITVLDLSLNSFYVDMAVLFFKAIRGTKIHKLILSQSSSMGRSVGYNNMKDPDKDTFKDLADSGIRIFDLSQCHIFALTYSVLGHLSDLERVSLASNSINKIERDAFLGAAHIKMLNLSYNLLDKIDSTTFKNLESLALLDLSYNNLKILMPGSFNGLPNLLYLDLRENSLQKVHTLAALPQLKVLLMGNNKIRSLYGLLSSARSVTIIDLASNKLSNAEDIYTILVELPQIEKIYIEGNVFLWCVHNSNYSVPPTNNLQILHLQSTGLPNIWSQGKCLDVFDNLHQLQLLFLQNNFMQSLPKNIFKGLTSLFYLDLSFNSLTYIPSDIFPESLRSLDLSYNNLGSVDPQALSTLSTIKLDGNRFLCDCSLGDFQTWLNETQKKTNIVGNVEDLMCEFPEQQHGVPLIYAVLCEDTDNEKIAENLRLALFICCTVFILLILTCAVVFVRLRGYCFKLYRKVIITFVEGRSKSPANDSFLYDVYLCFSSKDTGWVEKALLKKLDTQFSEKNNFRCCFEARDFLPGEDHLSNMRNAVWNSKKVLCIVSREFLKDGWCLEAFMLAQSKMLEEVKDVLLVLLVDKIPQYRLMKYEPIRTYIQTRRYLRWPEDSQDLEWFYNQIKQSILKGTKGKHVKTNTETNHNVTDIEAVTAF
ncbi:toll-like receptor 5 [Colossoma macropomum]|uniref:toll-like receptor 5 n=1 Tax=Colossoma macropomum TaxID=42526 RepID=UPI0018650E70|nr:toll-like receptor 5 [Colossoma macropomum]